MELLMKKYVPSLAAVLRLALACGIVFGLSCADLRAQGAEIHGLVIGYRGELDKPIPCLVLSTRDDVEKLRKIARQRLRCIREIIGGRTSSSKLLEFVGIIERRSPEGTEGNSMEVLRISEKPLPPLRISIAASLELMRRVVANVPEVREAVEDGIIERFPNERVREERQKAIMYRQPR
jgi:hypothetical protein